MKSPMSMTQYDGGIASRVAMHLSYMPDLPQNKRTKVCQLLHERPITAYALHRAADIMGVSVEQFLPEIQRSGG